MTILFNEADIEAAARAKLHKQNPDVPWDDWHYTIKDAAIEEARFHAAAVASLQEQDAFKTGCGHFVYYTDDFYELVATTSEPSKKTGRFPVAIIRIDDPSAMMVPTAYVYAPTTLAFFTPPMPTSAMKGKNSDAKLGSQTLNTTEPRGPD